MILRRYFFKRGNFMKKLWNIKFLWMLLFLICRVSASFAYDDQVQDTLECIFEHAQNAIDHFEEEKVFFKSEKMHLAQGKIYIETDNGGVVPIPYIFSNEHGLYVKLGSRRAQKIWICQGNKGNPCSWVYYEEPTRCLNCMGTRFIIRYM